MRRVAILILVCSCGQNGEGAVDADANHDPTYVEVALVPASPNRDLDILFLLEDSGALDKVTNLKIAFPAFVNFLNRAPGGLPSVHIGVATSDLGTLGADDAQPGPSIGSGPGSCAGQGKAGKLQTNGTVLVNGTYITDLLDSDGTRSTNYTGTLVNAFAALASVGAGGCGFEQHLEAAKRVFDNDQTNPGFLRATASLAVIMFAEEDDCSLAHSSLLGTNVAMLGALQSFRCTRFGVTCDRGGATTDEMNQLGEKGGCHSNESRQYLTDVARYTAFFNGLKQDPRNVMVGAILGDPGPVVVEPRTPPGGGMPVPALAHSCGYVVANQQMELADPGVRIAQLARTFRRHAVASVCKPDLTDAVLSMARQLRPLTGDSCLVRDIALPANCQVFDERGTVETAIPECANASLTDCYTLAADPQCPGQGLRLSVTRSSAPSADTMTSVRCKS